VGVVATRVLPSAFAAASPDPSYAHVAFIRIGSRADTVRLLVEQLANQ